MTVPGAEVTPKLWISDFLQSALVLDDQAYTLGGEEADGNLVHPADAPGRRTLSDKTRKAVEPDTQARKLNDLDTKGLTDSFAAYGVVCGVLCPTAADIGVETARLLKAARRADIVILDWQLNGDNGKAAKSTILELVSSGLTGNSLKLICIYTADSPNISTIMSDVKASVCAGGYRVDDGSSPYQCSVGAMQIALFSKVELKVPDEELVHRYASEEDLPKRIVELFESTTTGLLERFAIRALSVLRQNTHSIAAKFSKAIDPGYLWHRAALPDPVDAEAHIREILTSELDAVIEVSSSSEAANASECGRVVDCFQGPLASRFAMNEAVSQADVKSLFSESTLNGIAKRIRKKLTSEGGSVVDISAFSDTVENAKNANEQFAMLMMLRSHYIDTPRRLHLGTVVATPVKDKDVYYLCMQPLCDSERINETRQFPLLPVDSVEGAQFNLILPLRGGSGVGHFLIKYNPYRLIMPEFAVDEGGGGVPVKFNEGIYSVISVAGVQYEIIAELRTAIAHRIAQKLANQFGRIGLDVPEWIRERD